MEKYSINLVGKEIKHQKYGKGKITKQYGEYNECFDVHFYNPNCTYIVTKFSYPKAFEIKSMECLDKDFVKVIKKDIEKNKSDNLSLSSKVKKSVNKADFVLVYNGFRCKSYNHKVTNVTAIIKIRTWEGKEENESVVASYCNNCGLYYIKKTVVDELKQKGFLLCKCVDEELYFNWQLNKNENKLKQASVLMEYGYNVSSISSLTKQERQGILATLIDYDILDKNTILSYLEFFIKQRKNQNKDFTKAISKWKSDSEFVKKYRIEDFSKIFVKKIVKK